MQVKTFKSVDIKQALAMVKADMGSDAMILKTRKIKNRNGAFGMFTRPLIEVTAAVEEGELVAKRSKKTTMRRKPERNETSNSLSNATDIKNINDALDPLRDEINELKHLIGASNSAKMFGGLELKKAAGLADDLEETKNLISLMVEQSEFYRGLGLETNYLVCYRRMIDRGIDPDFALKLVRKVKDNVPGGRELPLAEIVSQIIENIGESMIVGDPIAPFDDGPRVVSLIGPTGVGKTTTIAKIAAGLTLQGKSVGLITIDTFRIAAVEQLKTYASILEVPLEVAMTPEELLYALKGFASKDVVLIDTAGRSQRDTKKLDELGAFLGGDGLIENYLVLSAAADPKSLDETVKNFGCVPISGLIFTKLDESTKPGVVISQNFKTGLPLVYCTTGQQVPEDIERTSPVKMGTRLFKKEL